MVAHIDKAAFTRADLVELVGALLPVDAPGDPRSLIEKIVDTVSTETVRRVLKKTNSSRG